MNILEFLFWFPVNGCNVEQWSSYILVFNGCRWDMIDYSSTSTSNLSWSGDPTGVVTPDRDMQLYKNTDDNTIYMSVGLTSADRVQLSTFTS